MRVNGRPNDATFDPLRRGITIEGEDFQPMEVTLDRQGAELLDACEARGVAYLEGGCPLMYCAPVDLAHRCMRWWLAHQGRVPVA